MAVPQLYVAIPQLYGKKLNRVPGTLFALHSDHDLLNGVRNTLSVTIRVKYETYV